MDPSYEDTDKTGAQTASVGDKVSVSEDREFLLGKQHFKSNWQEGIDWQPKDGK